MKYIYQIRFISCSNVDKIVPVRRYEVVDFIADLVLAGASDIRLITNVTALPSEKSVLLPLSYYVDRDNARKASNVSV